MDHVSAVDGPQPDPWAPDPGATDRWAADPWAADPWAADPWATDVAALRPAAARLAGIETALRALDDGSYGTCGVCGRELEDAVLLADPLARRCPDHLEARPPG